MKPSIASQLPYATTAERDSKGSRIGPPVRTVVTVEGADVDALVDSGSRVTIVSLALLLQVLGIQ